MSKSKLQDIIGEFDVEKLPSFFRSISSSYADTGEDLTAYDTDTFSGFQKLGEFRFSEIDRLAVVVSQVSSGLTERSSKKAQYDKAKQILKDYEVYSGGIFIYHDPQGSFRFSLVYERSAGTKRTWSNFRRFTYFVSKESPNKTFISRIGNANFSSIEKIKEAFSIVAVTDEFYRGFVPYFEKIANAVLKTTDDSDKKLAGNFALLFVIRVVFIGFIQKRKWIGDDERFLQNFWEEYKTDHFGKDEFYKRWLEPLFFEALSSPIGRKVKYGNNDFSEKTEAALQMAPYLNGGLFRAKKGVDNKGLYIPGAIIGEFFDWLFTYNFTIEENTLYDEELELNPEFLGIIFERLVNKADGAVYTPRVEVDFMCRMSLVKWLDKNTSDDIHYRDLYELFFREGGSSKGFEADQKHGSFSERQMEEILEKLETVTICDPAVGSGAFPVGMLHVMDDIEEYLREQLRIPSDKHQTAFTRKKRIISASLYGVEVKEWAVWITQLRLWITLFIDAPEELKNSMEPILPSLDFKIRTGDSLVQRVGKKTFPVSGHANVSQGVKRKVTELKKLKRDYFRNKSDRDFIIRQREIALFRDILNEDISERKKNLNELKGIKPAKQVSLFTGEVDEEQAQRQLSFNSDKIKKLEAEISEIQEQRQSLSDDHPLIWNIEFAEIFAEKGGFDIVIGNPPYVRQEDIDDPNGIVKSAKEYKQALQEMIRTDFPRQFPKGEKIDAKSDLYTYFYIRGLKLLNSDGVLTYICSNSWLDVGYGVWLQKFLLNSAPVDFIFDNHAKRSFEAADVNTIISIIEAPRKKVAKDHSVKFVAFKKPFEEVLVTEILLAVEDSKGIVSSDALRIYPVTNESLIDFGTEYINHEQKTLSGGKYVGDKWGGKYLRAPDIFFTILEKGEDKLTKLSALGDVRFGIKTGANDFFYISEETKMKWDIEDDFLRPVVHSPRESLAIKIDPSVLRYKLFVCRKTKEELRGTGALDYIEWGEQEGFNTRSSVSGRARWWSISERQVSPLHFNYLVNEVGTTYLGNIYASDNFHDLYIKDVYTGVLNSTVFWLIQNTAGRANFGGGLMKIQAGDLSKLLVPNVEIRNDQISNILERNIESVFTECGVDPKSDTPIEEQEPQPLEDRAQLDEVIFNVLGLDDEERKDVYRAVCRLVWNRLSKAKSA